MADSSERFEPRPAVRTVESGTKILGGRCVLCTHPVAGKWPRCPVCKGELVPAAFGSCGRVWSSTVIRFALPGRVPPYTLAYVDLDDGPRVLAHLHGADQDAIAVGTNVVLNGVTTHGDIEVKVLK